MCVLCQQKIENYNKDTLYNINTRVNTNKQNFYCDTIKKHVVLTK